MAMHDRQAEREAAAVREREGAAAAAEQRRLAQQAKQRRKAEARCCPPSLVSVITPLCPFARAGGGFVTYCL